MLLEEEDILLSKMIALLNGLDEFGYDKEFEQLIRDCLLAVQQQECLTPYIARLDDAKRKYLKDCIICMVPCGRTTDYHLNDLTEDIRLPKIKKWKSFLRNYREDTPFDKMVYEIASLGW